MTSYLTSFSLDYLLEFYLKPPIYSKPTPYRLSNLGDIRFHTAITRKVLLGDILEEVYGEGKAAGNILLPPTIHGKRKHDL